MDMFHDIDRYLWTKIRPPILLHRLFLFAAVSEGQVESPHTS